MLNAAPPQPAPQSGATLINLTESSGAVVAWPEDTKAALVEAGLALLSEQLRSGELDVFRLLSPTAVGKRARRNKALLYHHWPSDDDADRLKEYRKELYRRSVERFHQAAIRALGVPEPGETLEMAIERIVAALYSNLIADEKAFAIYRLSNAAVWTSADGEGGCESVNLAVISGFAATSLDVLGLELVAPWTESELVLVIAAIFDGLMLSLPAARQLMFTRSDGSPSPAAQTVVAAVRAATRPVAAGS